MKYQPNYLKCDYDNIIMDERVYYHLPFLRFIYYDPTFDGPLKHILRGRVY